MWPVFYGVVGEVVYAPEVCVEYFAVVCLQNEASVLRVYEYSVSYNVGYVVLVAVKREGVLFVVRGC